MISYIPIRVEKKMAERSAGFIDVQNVRLDDEELLSEDEVTRRRTIGARVLQLVPPEALQRLQILQPAIGCLNRCNFCSQEAGPVTRELGAESLRAIMGGLRGAMLAMGLDRVGGDRAHKDGVIFPYLDNDIGSYPHLVDYLVGMRSLGGRTRISTVGWSRHNAELQSMHTTIARGYIDDIDGIRFSFTPYTHGWRTSQQEYVADFGNALATYLPLFEQKGVGRRTACIELRFAPDIQLGEVEYSTVGPYSVINCEEYSLISRQSDLDEADNSFIAAMGDDGPILSGPGIEAVQILGRHEEFDAEALTRIFETAPTEKPAVSEDLGLLTHKGRMHVFQNADGPYFCFNPLRNPQDGTFTATHYYPRTQTRDVSGVLDASRPFLNNLLEIKRKNGIDVRDDYNGATDSDIIFLLESMRAEAEILGRFSERRQLYIHERVIPLIEGLCSAMTTAGLAAADIFRYGLVVDTGVIVNQGKAITEFKGLATKRDMPMTPNEEKGYGDVSQSSVRGNTWRIAPIAILDTALRQTGFGRKSLPLANSESDMALGVFEWNPQTFNNNTVAGTKLRSLYVPIGDVVDPLEKITPEQGKRSHRLPG